MLLRKPFAGVHPKEGCGNHRVWHGRAPACPVLSIKNRRICGKQTYATRFGGHAFPGMPLLCANGDLYRNPESLIVFRYDRRRKCVEPILALSKSRKSNVNRMAATGAPTPDRFCVCDYVGR